MIRIANVLYGSFVNGPGKRNVIHTQGCTLACKGCFNAHTHPHAGGVEWEPRELAIHTQKTNFSSSYTISGGEPFQQEDLDKLLGALRSRGADSILVFSGYTLKEILNSASRTRALQQIDVLVAGRYSRQHAIQRAGLRASSNQEVHRLTNRHTDSDLAIPPGVEVHIEGDKQIITGFPTSEMLKALGGAT